MSEPRKQDVERVPLSSIAPDARDLIQAYRESGEISFRTCPWPPRGKLPARLRGQWPAAPIAPSSAIMVPVPGATLRVRNRIGQAAGSAVHARGGWVIGNLDAHDAICRTLARKSGAAVYAVDYRLAPEHPFPTPLDDCAAALRWLVDHAASLDVDVSRLGLAGDSAGGNPAVWRTRRFCCRASCIVRAQVLFYPVTDLRGETASYQRIVAGFPDRQLDALVPRPASGYFLGRRVFPRFLPASFSLLAPRQRCPVPAELRAGSPGGRTRAWRPARVRVASPPASARWHHHVGDRYRARHADRAAAFLRETLLHNS